MKPSPWTCSVEAGNGNHTRFSKSQALAGGHGVALCALSLPSATTQRAQPLGRGPRRELGLVLMVLETPSHLLPAAAGTGLATVHGLSWVLGEGVLTDTVEKPAVECDLRRGRPAGQGAPSAEGSLWQRTTACPGDGCRGLWRLVPSLPHAHGAALCSRLLSAGPAAPMRSGAPGLLAGLTSCLPGRRVAVAGLRPPTPTHRTCGGREGRREGGLMPLRSEAGGGARRLSWARPRSHPAADCPAGRVSTSEAALPPWLCALKPRGATMCHVT